MFPFGDVRRSVDSGIFEKKVSREKRNDGTLRMEEACLPLFLALALTLSLCLSFALEAGGRPAGPVCVGRRFAWFSLSAENSTEKRNYLLPGHCSSMYRSAMRHEGTDHSGTDTQNACNHDHQLSRDNGVTFHTNQQRLPT